MLEPFKNLLNKQIIEVMATNFENHWSRFDVKGFVAAATNNLNALGLKARTECIAETMIEYLPTDFEKAATIMLESLDPLLADNISASTVDAKGVTGWAIMPMAHYVGLRG